MTRAHALLALRILTLLGLSASAALAVEYRSLDPSFCGAESGCGALQRTDLAHLFGLGLSLPDVGLIGLATVFVLSLTRRASWAAWLAIGGGVIALALLAVQTFVVGQFCWLCVVTDTAAVGAAVGGALWLRTPPSPSDREPLATWSWAALGVLALVAPALWPAMKPTPEAPSELRSYYRSGKINVIEFADFQCPHCRRLHGRLKALLEPYGARVHFVRLNMPLRSHPQARGAALAAICAEKSGQADALADFMFSTVDLSTANITRKAVELGIDGGEFERCLEAPETQARLEREGRILRDIGFRGLPTTYVGDQPIIGAQSDEVFRDALAAAASGESERGVPAWAYVTFFALVVSALVRSGLRPSSPERERRRAAEAA
ncbi:MAG TPA: thioredoxin domain-containing protein [Polyangiaceae bacterium]|nr:thioredoxin domain-containing protein [Polyangiaceae bacterium]